MVKIILYVFLYASLVTSVSVLLKDSPTVRQMENVFFDEFQKWSTIDRVDDLHNHAFKDIIDQLYFINIDSSFFDFDCGRVDKNRLSLLLDVLKKKTENKAIYLDYTFEKSISHSKVDSVLISSMQKLGKRLILPNRIRMGERPMWGSVQHQPLDKKLSDDIRYGYLDIRRFEDRSTAYRTMQVGNSNDTFLSIPIAIALAKDDLHNHYKLRNTPPVIELNNILRNSSHRLNEKKNIQDRAVIYQNASYVLQGNVLPTSDKIIFIGLFAPLKNNDGHYFDRLPSAVASSQPGIYIIINAYLDLITKSYFRAASSWFTFLINTLLISISVAYSKHSIGKYAKGLKPISMQMIEILLSTASFHFFIWGIFALYYVKFPFIICYVFLSANHFVYLNFKKLVKI